MAQATVANKAFTDPRFAHLGLIIAGPNQEIPLAPLGIGVMAYVWSHATEEASGVLLALDLDMIGMSLGVTELSKAIVQCGLGEKVKGGIRIKGTTDRPPDWKQKLNEANKERQRRWRERHPVSNADVTVTSQRMSRAVTGVPTPTPTPTPKRQEESESPRETRYEEPIEAPAYGPSHPLPRPPRPREAHRDVLRDGIAALRGKPATLDEAAEQAAEESVKMRLRVEAAVIREHPDWSSEQKREEIARQYEAARTAAKEPAP